MANGCVRTSTTSSGPGRPSTPSIFDLAEKFVYVGMDVESMTRLVGTPEQIAPAPDGEVWYYEFGAVVVGDGRVRYKYPQSSPAGFAVQRSGGVESNVEGAAGKAGD